jgi:hypothetical protein
MQLMKWFRKNNQKIMAIVVVVLMLGFVGGTALTRSCENLGQSRSKVVAVFGQNQKIRLTDLDIAQNELLILQELKADIILKSLSVPMLQINNLQGIALDEVIFSERQASPLVVSYLKQSKAQGFTISDKQIYDLYKRSEPSHVYWLVLKKEAEQAGIKIPKEQAKDFLVRNLPQLFGGATYAQVINSIVNASVRSETMHATEEQILSAFSNLIAVLEYTRTICSAENITSQQMMHGIQNVMQTVDVNFVRFNSDVFTKSVPEPDAGQISEQFEKYKDYFAGQISEQNPYGFGYKIPDNVQFQYIAIKLDDVEKIVSKPTQEEMEQYYNKYKAFLTDKVLSDPNDPNSAVIDRTKTFAETADSIEKILLQEKINTKSNQIIQKALTLTENFSAGTKEITAEQFQKIENNYTTATEQLKKEYGIEVIAGQTGLLSAYDIEQDATFGRLILEGPQFDPVRNPSYEWLHKILFAVDQIGISEIDTINFTKPQMYKSIGPLNDMTGKIKAIVRIIKAQKASPPESIGQIFSKDTINTEPNDIKIIVYSVKGSVVKDLKRLAAMNVAKAKAEEFQKQVEQTGNWQQAVDKLNKLYPKDPDTKPVDVNNFELSSLSRQRQISETTLQTLNMHTIGNPAMESELRNFQKQRLFVDQLKRLVPADANNQKIPSVWEFKPNISYYCIKDLSVKPVYQSDYDAEKISQMLLEDIVRSQSLALVHFNPDNILKRNNFEWLNKERQKDNASDANQPNI